MSYWEEMVNIPLFRNDYQVWILVSTTCSEINSRVIRQLMATFITKCLKYIFLIGYTVLVYHFLLRILDFDISQCVSSYIFNHYCFRMQDILLCQNIRKKTDISCTDELCLVFLPIYKNTRQNTLGIVYYWMTLPKCTRVKKSVRTQYIYTFITR